MRVTRCFIGGYREIKDSSFSPEGLVVLVGANGTGKTSALEALRLALAPPPDDDGATDLGGLGRIWLRVELDGLGIADHRDNDLWDELLTLKHLFPGTEDEFSIPGQGPELEGVQELLADDPTTTATATAIEILTDFLVEGGPGNPVDRREVVEAALAQTSLLIGLQTVRLLFPGEDLTQAPLVEAAGRITAVNDDSADPVLDWAAAIVDGRNVPGLLLGSRDSCEIALPHPQVLSTDPADLEAGVAAAIEAAHDIRYQYVSKLVIPDRVLLGIVPSAASDRLDPWLESLEEEDDESEPELPGPDGWAMNVTVPAAMMLSGAQIQLDPCPLPKQAPDHWVRLKPTIVATAEYFSAWANELAPSFISDLGTIEVEIQAPAAWQTYEARVRIFFVRSDLSRRPLEELSDGIRRWVAATLRLAAHRFTGASQAFLIEDDQTLDVDAADDLVDRARADPYDQALVTLIPRDSDPDVLWLIDEPESHLHPAAVISVVKWLRARATESTGAAVATHHPAFLSIPAEAGQVVLATRDIEGCHLKAVSGGVRRSVSLIAAEFGLRPAELLSLTRLVLFVEGPHDVIVLESFIGEELEALGILVLPMHGVDNGLSALLESEILTELDLKLAVLTDDTSPERIAASDPRSRIEQAAVRLKREVHMRGGQIETLGLRKPDVLQYLDDEVCRAAAPAFPGWDEAVEECRRSGDMRDFKKFVTRTYQLDLGRESVRRLATETRLQGRVSKEFERILRQLASVSGKSDEFFEEFTKQASP